MVAWKMTCKVPHLISNWKRKFGKWGNVDGRKQRKQILHSVTTAIKQLSTRWECELLTAWSPFDSCNSHPRLDIIPVLLPFFDCHRLSSATDWVEQSRSKSTKCHDFIWLSSFHRIGFCIPVEMEYSENNGKIFLSAWYDPGCLHSRWARQNSYLMVEPVMNQSPFDNPCRLTLKMTTLCFRLSITDWKETARMNEWMNVKAKTVAIVLSNNRGFSIEIHLSRRRFHGR